MKTLPKQVNLRHAVVNGIKRIACIKTLQIPVCVISVSLCSAFAIEGGYQLHLSHDHSALSCVQLSVPAPVAPGDQFEPLPYVAPAACKEPDEPGQPWRLNLVLLDMVGFALFGSFGLQMGKQLIFAGPVAN